MRVRIRKDPSDHWVVESKNWYEYHWRYEQSFHTGDMKERALQYAKNLIDPEIIEVFK